MEHVGTEDIELLDLMLDLGPSELDAVATFEPTVLLYAKQRAADIAQWNDSLVFVYPNHAVWDTHPYCLINATWVTPEQREAGLVFLDYLLSNTSYALMAQHGIRCVCVGLFLYCASSLQHGGGRRVLNWVDSVCCVVGAIQL